MENLDLIPIGELVETLLRREGVAVVVGVYDLKNRADGCDTTPTFHIASSGDHPLREALGLMIREHIFQLRERKMRIDDDD